MATTVNTIAAKIEAVIAALVPTDEPAQRFRLRSDEPAALENLSAPSGMERAFGVWYVGQADGDYHHPQEHEQIARFLVRVLYPMTSDLRALGRRISSDVHDIKVALETGGNWVTDEINQTVPEVEAPEPTEDGTVIQSINVVAQFLESSV